MPLNLSDLCRPLVRKSVTVAGRVWSISPVTSSTSMAIAAAIPMPVEPAPPGTEAGDAAKDLHAQAMLIYEIDMNRQLRRRTAAAVATALELGLGAVGPAFGIAAYYPAAADAIMDRLNEVEIAQLAREVMNFGFGEAIKEARKN